jgi:prephenate dehydrogenase
LAGSEKQGSDAARADLFDNHLTILTPTERTPEAAVEGSRRFWESLGCRVRLMSPQEHDRGVAMTSHLPHLLSAVLAGMLPEALRELTASGFRDMTRLAAGDPALWSAIFSQNRVNVLDAIEALQKRLPLFAGALRTNDAKAIEQLLADAKRIRDDLGD